MNTETKLPAYDIDLTAVLASVNGLFKVGAVFKYAELEARIRMQMAMRKMIGRENYQTPEWYANRIANNLRLAGYAVIRDGVIEVKPRMSSFLEYVAHWARQRDKYTHQAALDDYLAGFDDQQ